MIVTPEAEEDLERIGDFIAKGNPRRAESFIAEILVRCEKLADMPLRYQLLPSREESEIRRMPYRNYAIFYRVAGKEIYILHILNGAQDHEAILFPEDDEA